VFLFGGAEGVAEAACRVLNARSAGVRCVGSLYPGYRSIDEMATDDIIGHVNSSGAEFLAVSLGAKKGQAWLLRNHDRLLVPVRVHLGATVNFQAGTVKRAPLVLQRLGLEWLWRIKEEPHLWRRYWDDGWVFLRLLWMCVLPLWFRRWRPNPKGERANFMIAHDQNSDSVVLRLSGPATVVNVPQAALAFRRAANMGKRVIIDLSEVNEIDARFLGLLFMLNKTLKGVGARPTLIGLSPKLRKLFRLHGAEFLLFRDKDLDPR
jgi:N-acetylglucosaminyldiphosphoundecaprenol N-acetyl-beta-D-mannosaminyltransferase